MTELEFRANIRELMTSGVLPADPPLIERAREQLGNRRTRSVVSGPLPELCTVCGEPSPQVSYFYVAGQVVRIHAAYDALWQQERRTR